MKERQELEDRSLVASTREFIPDNLLEQNLQQEVTSEHHLQTLSKELFSKFNIELKTELSHNEINHVTKLLFLNDRHMISNVDVLISSFLKLRVSKDRKSRREFVESLQTEARNQQGSGFMNGLKGMFGRNNDGN